MSVEREMLLEQLFLEVLCPAKAKLLRGKKKIVLVRRNGRFIGGEERSLTEWWKLFSEVDLDFDHELKQLVTEKLGAQYVVIEEEVTGYLGVNSDHWFELRISRSRKQRVRRDV